MPGKGSKSYDSLSVSERLALRIPSAYCLYILLDDSRQYEGDTSIKDGERGSFQLRHLSVDILEHKLADAISTWTWLLLGNFGGEPIRTGMTLLPECSSVVLNAGENCWKRCSKKSGPCPNFCGKDGYCCRKNYNGGEEGCSKTMGADFMHVAEDRLCSPFRANIRLDQ